MGVMARGTGHIITFQIAFTQREQSKLIAVHLSLARGVTPIEGHVLFNQHVTRLE
jgi:hypothetical protein